MFESVDNNNVENNNVNNNNENNGNTNDRQTMGRRPVFAPEPSPARKVAEGAMLVAAAVIFGLSASYLPFLWLVAMFLWPVPLALLVRRFGPGFGLAGTLLTTLILALFLGPLAAVFMLLNMGGVGFWYGYAARKELRPWFTVVAGVFIAAVSMVLMIVFSSLFTGLQLADLQRQLDEMVELYVGTMQRQGQLEQLLGSYSVAEYTKALQETVAQLLPASLIFLAMLEAGICYALNSYIFRRLGYPMAKLPPFREWRLHWMSLWGLIIALLAFIAYRNLELEWCQVLYSNIMYIYQPLLLMSGVTLVYWLADRLQMFWLYFLFLFMLVFYFNVTGPLLVLMGLSDSIWDIRRMFAKPPMDRVN